jgi:hypothetical protein
MDPNRSIPGSQPSPGDAERLAFANLLGIATDALRMHPPLFLDSVLGPPTSWIPPFHRYSEFRVIDPWQPVRTLRFLVNATLPSIPRLPPTFGAPLVDLFFWRPTVILQRPDHYGSYTAFPHEAWFFLNGILTNDSVAQINAAYLAYLFHRPITLIQNSTCGGLVDLLECALGKQWGRTTEAAARAFPPIYDALKSEKRKVVLIAHSQGTIIASLVVKMLAGLTRPVLAPFEEPFGERTPQQPFEGPTFVYPDDAPLDLRDFDPLSEQELAKLEVYCFANCANVLRYYRPPGYATPPIPWIESYGNEHDIVARLGMLAPNADARGILIQGPRYLRRGGWGHLLNAHYLIPIEQAQKVGRRRGGQHGTAPYELIDNDTVPASSVPRLYAYINGGSPG